MFARAAITSTTVAGLTVPAKAVQPQPDGSALYSCYRVRTKAQPVEVGKFSVVEGWKLEGFETCDRVVVAGAGYLKDGDHVRCSN